MTEAEILEDFSELTSEDIKACLAFATDREKKLLPASWQQHVLEVDKGGLSIELK
jgi:hypothetical protein